MRRVDIKYNLFHYCYVVLKAPIGIRLFRHAKEEAAKGRVIYLTSNDFFFMNLVIFPPILLQPLVLQSDGNI